MNRLILRTSSPIALPTVACDSSWMRTEAKKSSVATSPTVRYIPQP